MASPAVKESQGAVGQCSADSAGAVPPGLLSQCRSIAPSEPVHLVLQPRWTTRSGGTL